MNHYGTMAGWCGVLGAIGLVRGARRITASLLSLYMWGLSSSFYTGQPVANLLKDLQSNSDLKSLEMTMIKRVSNELGDFLDLRFSKTVPRGDRYWQSTFRKSYSRYESNLPTLGLPNTPHAHTV